MYKLDVSNKINSSDFNAIILSVSHDEYMNIGLSKWKKLFKSTGVLVDVKSVYKIDFFSKTNIEHWRL